MNVKHILLTCLVSIVTSVAVCLVFLFATRTNRMAGPGSTEISAWAPEKTSPLPANPAAPREEMESLEAAVERLESEVRELKKREEASTSSGDRRKSAVRELLERPHLNNEIMKEAMLRIMLEGDGAVDAIVQRLRTGENVDLGGGMSTSGTQMTTFPNLKTALLYTLYSLGTEKARTACFQHLATGAEAAEIAPMLCYLDFVDVDVAWNEQLKGVVARGLSLIASMDRAQVEGSPYPETLVRGVCGCMDRFSLPEAAGVLKAAMEKRIFMQRDERYLFDGLMDASHEEGTAYVLRRLQDPDRDRKATLTLFGTCKTLLPEKIESARTLLANGSLSREERTILYKGLAHTTRIYGIRSRERPGEIKGHFTALLHFLESSKAAEADPGVREALDESIAIVREQIG